MSEVDNLSEKARQNPSEVQFARILDAFDALIDELEEHKAAYEAELPAAQETGNVPYIKRVERGASQAQQLIDLLEEEFLEKVGMLRFSAGQMRAAREERMV